MVLLNQHQDVVDVYLHLSDEFGFKDEVVVYHLFIHIGSLPPLFPQIEVVRLVVLHLPVGEQFFTLELVESLQYVDALQQTSEQTDKPSLLLLTHCRSSVGKLVHQLLRQL